MGKKRGRPSKNGARNGAFMGRDLSIVTAFEKARAEGEKFDSASEIAQHADRRRYGKISRTEVRRALSRWRPKGAAEGYLIEVGTLGEDDLAEHHRTNEKLAAAFPDQFRGVDLRPKRVRSLTGSVGPVPVFPRANAKEPKQSAKKGPSIRK